MQLWQLDRQVHRFKQIKTGSTQKHEGNIHADTPRFRLHFERRARRAMKADAFFQLITFDSSLIIFSLRLCVLRVIFWERLPPVFANLTLLQDQETLL